MTRDEELIARAHEYARRARATLGERFGCGAHGIVFGLDRPADSSLGAVRSAVKFHRGEPGYKREHAVYLRFRDLSLDLIHGCNIPRLLAYDARLLAIEMTVVTRPFLLDFAGAYLDEPPQFSEDTVAEWRAEKSEEFGSRWPDVQRIVRELEAYGVYMLDVNPGNVSFEP